MLTKLFTTAGLNKRAGNGMVLTEDNAIVAFKATEVQTQQEPVQSTALCVRETKRKRELAPPRISGSPKDQQTL